MWLTGEERGERENRGERGEKGGEGVLSCMLGCAEQTCNSDVSKRQKKQKADPQSRGTWTSNCRHSVKFMTDSVYFHFEHG